jgi:hypothetical protein
MTRESLPHLWTCPKCGAKFVSANMSHSCGRYRVEDLFAKSVPHLLEVYLALEEIVEACGPVITIPQKTRLVFMVRMRFASVYPRKTNLRVGLIMTRRLDDEPRVEKIETYGPQTIANYLRIDRVEQLDKHVRRWVKEAYDRGSQKGFERHGNTARPAKPTSRR